MEIAGKAVLVAGGAGYLGKAVVQALRARGAQIAVIDRHPDGSAFFPDGGLSYHVANAADETEASAAIEEVAARLGGLDVLVNCVGLIHSEPLINLLSPEHRRHTVESWNTVLHTNLSTAFVLGSLVAERMAVARSKGVIVNFSSVAAAGNAGQSAYSAAKAGLEALTAVWGKELGSFGIRVVAIAPGFVDTPSMHAMGEQHVKDWVRKTPLHRLGSVDAVTGAVVFAIENDFITGRTIHVDGGLTI